MSDDEYLTINRAYWDDRAPAHAAAADYGIPRFVADPAALSDVVAFDRERLGDLSGMRGLHLQCHIGTDTLSLHRLGARMTGLDLSPVSLREARALAAAVGADIEYVEAESYRAVEVLGAGGFDLVYSSIGTLLWLPDIARWGRVVADLLAPGGRLFIRDSHPMVSALEASGDDAVLRYSYFTPEQPLVFDGTDTYVETGGPLADLPTWEWSHGIGEILGAVLDAGLTITGYTEHDSVPFRALDHLMAPHPEHPGELRLAEHPERLAASFTLQATKPA
jgi:SAM-dependent methyltransferase